MEAFNVVKKFIFYKKVNIDSILFKIHYRVTFALLVGASLINTGKQNFGDPIACNPDKELGQKLIDQYCLAEATFIVEPNTTEAYGGISKYVHGTVRNIEFYYQWVWLFLYLQAFCFYLPHLIWKFFEAGRTEKMIGAIHGFCFDENIDEMVRKAAEIFIKNRSMCSANLVIVYIICEALNLVNIFGQWFLIGKFLYCDFFWAGYSMVPFLPEENRANPMSKLFPSVSKCEFIGPSGWKRRDILCIMTINILNAKLFSFFWFWFVFVHLVTIVGFIAIVIRVLIINRYSSLLRLYLNCVASPADDYSTIMRELNRNLSFSDYFLLEMLTKNLSGANKLNFVRHIHTSMPTNHSSFELHTNPQIEI